MATAITSIAFDHQLYLGSTLREIAIEKAGIIKPGVPVVVGVLDAEAAAAIDEVARERGAEVIRTSPGEVEGFTIGLRGSHQRANAAVARTLLAVVDARGLAVPPAAIATGLATVEWPGRLDWRRLADGREALLDAAHNPAGAVALASYLKDLPGPALPLVFAAMRDKDIRDMLSVLLPVTSRLVVTRAPMARSADPSAILTLARGIAPSLEMSAEASVGAALDRAWRASSRIVVAGSIFLLGEVIREIAPC